MFFLHLTADQRRLSLGCTVEGFLHVYQYSHPLGSHCSQLGVWHPCDAPYGWRISYFYPFFLVFLHFQVWWQQTAIKRQILKQICSSFLIWVQTDEYKGHISSLWHLFWSVKMHFPKNKSIRTLWLHLCKRFYSRNVIFKGDNDCRRKFVIPLAEKLSDLAPYSISLCTFSSLCLWWRERRTDFVQSVNLVGWEF